MSTERFLTPNEKEVKGSGRCSLVEELTLWELDLAREQVYLGSRVLPLADFIATSTPEDRPVVEANLTNLSPILNFEFKDQTTRRHFAVHARRVGETYRGVIVDITRGRQIEDELKTLYTRLQRLVDSNIIGVVFYGKDGEIVEANDAFLDMIGFSREHLTSGLVNWRWLTPPEWRNADALAIDELRLRGTSTPFEKEYFRRDGSRVSVVVGAANFEDGSGRGVAFILDSTSGKRAEAEVRRREQESRFLASASDELSRSLDLETTLNRTVSLCNQEFGGWAFIHFVDEEGRIPLRAASHEDSELVARAFESSQKFPRNPNYPHGPSSVIRTGIPEYMEKIPESVLMENSESPEQLRMILDWHLVSYMTVPLTARYRTFGALTLASDSAIITPQHFWLAQEFGKRAALAIDNARLYQELRHAVQARDEFLSIASHELKTPITSLKLQLQMTNRGVDATKNVVPPAEKLSRAFVLSLKQVQRLQDIVEDLLDVSRLRAGKLNFKFEEVDFSNLVLEVIERFKDQFQEAKSPVELEIEEGVVGYWDKGRVEQIVDNLLSNALKYAPQALVRVRLKRVFDQAILVIEDRGPGIPRDKQSCIFNRFERVGNTSSPSGLGLGLFIVKNITEAHGGRVEVESEAGRGAKFRVELPLRPRLPEGSK